jgi:glutathione S-transferase
MADWDSKGIMEGAAILSYLTRHFDPDHKFSFTRDPELSICEQWVAWQTGGLGPVRPTLTVTRIIHPG